MLTPEYEQELRSLIKPAYANVIGTESYERRVLLEEIDRLRGLLRGIVSSDAGKPVQWKLEQGQSVNTDEGELLEALGNH